MFSSMRFVGVTVAFVLLLACSAPAQQRAVPPATGGDAAARVGTRTVTMKEVEDRWRERNPTELVQAMQAIYEGRRQALDAIIADMLIEQAAKAASQTPERYSEDQLKARVKPVTDAEIQAFFTQNQAQMQGRGAVEMAPVIRTYLEDQQRQSARDALIADLRKSGPAVSVLFDAPRQTVPIASDDAVRGAANAPVTIVEFSDFQCPFCERVEPTLKRIRETYGDKVRLVWKDFPLTRIHPEALKAAEAGNCAREQGKFWEFHDRLFANQQSLQPAALKAHAVAVGLDPVAFNTCFDAAKHGQRVQDQMSLGTRLGVNSTPTSFINGRLVTGAVPYEAYAAVIDEELQRAARK